MEEWTWSILLIGVLVAAIAAIAAWRSAKATENTGLAQTLMQITDAYSSPEMLSGMLRLYSFKERFQENFGGVFAQLRENNYKDIKKLTKLEEDIPTTSTKSGFFLTVGLLIKNL